MLERIRLATIEDAAAISNLITPLAEKYIAHEFADSGAKALLESLNPQAIARYIDSGYRYHVVEQQGVLIGVAATRDYSHLYHLFVAESSQGRGLARRLWQTAKEASQSAGHRGDFTVNSSRFAVGLYEKLGFVREGPEVERGGVIAVPMRWHASKSQGR